MYQPPMIRVVSQGCVPRSEPAWLSYVHTYADLSQEENSAGIAEWAQEAAH